MKIVLIGMSGSGKTTFGSFIATLMNMPLIDTDVEICKKYSDISAIFNSAGEKVFREFENHEGMLASMQDNCIVATGGGMVLNEEAMRALRKNSLVVYLNCDVDFLFSRLEGKEDRPLLNGENKKEKIEEMLRKRSDLYFKYAHIVLNESGILRSRNLLEEPQEIQLGALYVEFMRAFEKRVYSKYSG